MIWNPRLRSVCTPICRAKNSKFSATPPSAGAKRLLLDTGCRARLDQIRALATYVQFGEMEKFVENMQAARFLPHTDASRYPSVMRRLRERGKAHLTVCSAL